MHNICKKYTYNSTTKEYANVKSVYIAQNVYKNLKGIYTTNTKMVKIKSATC